MDEQRLFDNIDKIKDKINDNHKEVFKTVSKIDKTVEVINTKFKGLDCQDAGEPCTNVNKHNKDKHRPITFYRALTVICITLTILYTAYQIAQAVSK